MRLDRDRETRATQQRLTRRGYCSLILVVSAAIGCGQTKEEGPPVATLEAASLGSAGDALRLSVRSAHRRARGRR